MKLLDSDLKPRTLICTFFIVICVAAITTITTQRSFAQYPQTSRISFVFEVHRYLGIDQQGDSVTIEVRNNLNNYEPPRTLRISFNNRFTSIEHDSVVDFVAEKGIDLNSVKYVRFYPGMDERYERSPGASTPPPLYLTFTDVNWPSAEGVQITGVQKDEINTVCTLSIPLPASEYQITVVPQDDASVASPEPLINVVKKVSAGKTHTVWVRSPTFLESLSERFGNKNSLLVSIIVGLLAVIVAVLKDKIKDVVNWVLDGLGKFGRGKLAKRRFYRKYLGVMVSKHKHLRLVGFSSTGVSRPLLEEVFVSLRISGHSRRELDSDEGTGSVDGVGAVTFATALLQYPKMVILGSPGAGKTTTLSYALLTFAQNRQKERFGINEQLLPIFIPLRRLSGRDKSITEDLVNPETQILPKDLLKDLPKEYFENALNKGHCLVLLDGLDEVIDERTYRNVADKINDLVSAYPNNRFVVTCRIAGWKSYLTGEFTVLQTQDFNRDEIQRFVLGWHRAVITQSEHSRLYFDTPDKKEFEKTWVKHYEEKVKPAIEIKSRNLLNQIDSNNRILAIAVNPMLLSLTCLVHSVRNILPRGRTILYSQCLDLLIDSWERSKDIVWHQADRTTSYQKEAVLREIAFDFQVRGKGEDTKENIEKLIHAISKDLGIGIPPGELLEEIELRSGLLIERSIGVFGFSHLTLQEYLVAKHVLLYPRQLELLFTNLDKQEWREVILLYAGLLDNATDVIKTILKSSVAGNVGTLVLAGHCVGDSQNCDADIAERVIRDLTTTLYTDSDNREALLGAMSALAVDFTSEPKTPRENFSSYLIEGVQDPNGLNSPYLNPTQIRGDYITILGRAKVTAGLGTIVDLLFDEILETRNAAAYALISFGDLALSHLSTAFERVSQLIISNAVADEDAFFEALIFDGEDSPENMKRDARVISAYIKILRSINTGGSAKLLLKFYDLEQIMRSREWVGSVKVSVALAQMLNNPFIEVDLQQVSKEALPTSIRQIESEDDRWPYKNVPPYSGFSQLESRIMCDLSFLIKKSTRAINSYSNRVDWGAISFKVMFPSLLKYIKSVPAIELKQQSLAIMPRELWTELGFDQRVETSYLNALAFQIHDSYATSLSKALQHVGVEETTYSAAPPRRRLMRITVWLSNIYFTAFLAFAVYLQSDVTMGVIQDWNRIRWYSELDLIWFLIAPLWMYLFIVVLTQLKLGRRLLSLDTIGTLIFPISNFWKAYRNNVTSRKWLKFASVQIIMFFFNPITLIALLQFMRLPKDILVAKFSTITLFLGLYVLLAALSAAYLKFYLLTGNPIFQLLLLHPEGKKVVTSS